jgi:hypothetical protein
VKRYITIPENILLHQPDGSAAQDDAGQQIVAKFHGFIFDRSIDIVFAGEKGWDFDAVAARKEISTAVKQMTPGDVFSMDDETWKRLERSVRNPSPPGYSNPFLAEQLFPFMLAILNATCDEPK